MMASLYHSSPDWPAVFGAVVVSIDGMTFITASREAAEQYGGIAHRIDPYMQAPPFHCAPLAGDQVFHRGHVSALAAGIDLDVADGKPELMRIARQRNRPDYRFGPVRRFLDEGDDIAVVHADETQVDGLLE